MDFSPFCKRLKMTKFLFFLKNHTPKISSKTKNPARPKTIHYYICKNFHFTDKEFMDFSPFYKRLKMTKSLFLIQSQPYYIYKKFLIKQTHSKKIPPKLSKTNRTQKLATTKNFSTNHHNLIIYAKIFTLWIFRYAQNDKTLVF